MKSAGVYPTGPVSAWPLERNERLMETAAKIDTGEMVHSKKVKPTPVHMLASLSKTVGQAVRHGRVSAEVREERYNTCKACPFFIKDSKRCSECGCFMEAKTWVGGDPDMLCPKKKWSR